MKIRAMKNLFAIAFITIVLICSCKNEDNSIDKLIQADQALQTNSTEAQMKEYAPGVIPTNHRLYELLLDEQSQNWKSFYTYFQDELPLDKDKLYYDNLEWVAIKMILNDPDFYNEAELKIKDDIWIKLEQRKIINEPEFSFKLILNLSPYVTPEITAKRIYKVEQINTKGYSDNSVRAKHFEKHKEHYESVQYLKYNRWGSPLF